MSALVLALPPPWLLSTPWLTVRNHSWLRDSFSKVTSSGSSPVGCSIRDLLQFADRLHKGGIDFISLKERFDTSTAAGRFVFHFFAVLTKFEKS